jgi:general secretion pathway protein L
LPVLKNVLGLDLGSHSIKAVEFRQTLRGIEAVQMRMLPRGNHEMPLSEMVRGFVELHRLSTAHVIVALPGDSVVARRLEFPFRERRRLTQAVPFELAGAVPYELDDYVVDWDVASEERGRADVMATIAPRSEVAALLEMLREAGIQPRTVEAEGPVLGNLGGVFELPGTRLLADLGHRKSTFCLLVEGRAVAARTVPIGGQALTEAIAGGRRLSRADAELAKCEDGLRDGGQVLDRLARELVRTLGSLESVVSRAGTEPVSEITIFGGTSQLEGLDEFLSERTGMPTRRLGLPAASQGAGLVAGGSPLLFAPAIALGLRGTPRARTRLDFRQDEFALRVDLSGLRREFGWTGVLAGAALLLALVSFGTGVLVESRRASLLEREIARLYSEALPGQPVPSSAVTGLREAVRSANERAEFLGVYRGNLSALDLLAEVSKRVPADLEISLDELSIDRQTIRMRCHTKSFEAADRLGAELAKFAPFAQAHIGSIETDRKTGAKRFNVTISLAPPERA